MANQFAFYFDASACNGCKGCVIACKSKNDLPVGINWRKVYDYGGGHWIEDPDNPSLKIPNSFFGYSVSVACMHCENPLCVDVCPSAAISKLDNGVVLIDQDACIGCRYCEWACPYDAPQYDEGQRAMTKCDMCIDLINVGENPYCVDACVMRALDFGELDELRQKYGDEAAIEPLPDSEITKPAVVITPHRDAQKSGKGTGRILDLEEA